MVVLNLSVLIHEEIKNYWDGEVEKDNEVNASIRERWEDIDKPKQKKLHLDGDGVIKELTELLATGFHITRSETQWQVHESMINSLLPVIYGEEWEVNQGRILSNLGLSELEQEVMIVMARREGKSYSVGMGVAALLLKVPNINIAVFATGKRMAQALLDIVKNFLELAWKHSVNQKGYSILHQNAEAFILKGPDGSIRSVRIMPGTPKVNSFFLMTTHKNSFLCFCGRGRTN